MASIVEQIEAARLSLLDLTMRNRLLNYRPSRVRTVSVVDEVPREVFDILVAQEKTMRFDAKPDGELSVASDVGDEAVELWTLPQEKHTDRYLQTDLVQEHLQRRLFHVSNQAQSFLEEQIFLQIRCTDWPRSSPMRRATRRWSFFPRLIDVFNEVLGPGFRLDHGPGLIRMQRGTEGHRLHGGMTFDRASITASPMAECTRACASPPGN